MKSVHTKRNAIAGQIVFDALTTTATITTNGMASITLINTFVGASGDPIVYGKISVSGTQVDISGSVVPANTYKPINIIGYDELVITLDASLSIGETSTIDYVLSSSTVVMPSSDVLPAINTQNEILNLSEVIDFTTLATSSTLTTAGKTNVQLAARFTTATTAPTVQFYGQTGVGDFKIGTPQTLVAGVITIVSATDAAFVGIYAKVTVAGTSVDGGVIELKAWR